MNETLSYMIIWLMSCVAFLIGKRLYGESPIKQFQAGVFYGIGVGCTAIIFVSIWIS